MQLHVNPTPFTDMPTMEFVERALMPDRAITTELVSRSALSRIDDLRALARVVLSIDILVDHHKAWRAAVDYVNRSPEEKQVAIGSSPLFRRWLHVCGRALIEDAGLITVYALLSHVSNYTVGHADDAPSGLRLAVRDSIVETWDCAAISDDTARKVDILPRSSIVVRNDLPGLRVSLDETRVPERDTTVRQNDIDDRAISYPAGSFPVLLDAAATVLAAWPEEYEDWKQTLRVVVPRMPPAGWRMEGFTISSMQGAIWINPGEFLMSLESMVHEQSHVKLRYLEEAVPLLQGEQTGKRFPVGWRTDTRPIVGIYEGVYVHVHCAIAFSRALECGMLEKRYRSEASLRLKDLVSQADEGLKILRENGRFTEAGQGFLNWAQRSLGEL